MNYTDPRPTAVFDTECYCNFWSIGFKDVDTKERLHFEKWNDSELDLKAIARVFKKYRVIGFNSNNYDMPMVAYAMSGATNAELKRASDTIIQHNMSRWRFYQEYNVSLPDWIDHIDLMEVSPGSPQKPSLKIYAGRLHSHTMRDLPFEPDATITAQKRVVLNSYHDNDLDVTEDFYFELKNGIDLRAQMSDQYKVDLRSKSGPQVAEAVVKAEVERLTKKRLYAPEAKVRSFNYQAPDFIEFETAQLQNLYDVVTTAPFATQYVKSKKTGKLELTVVAPSELNDIAIKIGQGEYSFGLGGLHSCESNIAHIADDEFEIIDADVASYYPSLILNGGFVPKHIGEAFMRVYRAIYKRRLAAKREGRKDEAEALKLVLNGLFGKLGSAYSVVYSPDLMIQTTITGQLAVLMLIERLEVRGFRVISANTDGFVTKVPRSRRWEYDALIFDWECDTSLETEKTFYKGLYSASVNAYFAITTDGKVKGKGPYAPAGPGLRGADGMKKNPNFEVCIDAVVAYLKNGTPFAETIRACNDVRMFVTIRKVNGGAVDQNGVYLGKAIRWIQGTGIQGTLTYSTSGNNVPKSEGAFPLMTLPDELPNNVDYEWYERECYAILQDIGMNVGDPALQGRKGLMLARLPDQKTIHEVSLPTGVALCGKATSGIREKWVEFHRLPQGMRLCGKCRAESEL